MDLTLLQTAGAGLSTATVILLTYLAFKVHDIDKRMQRHEVTSARMLTRLQSLSGKAGLPELET